MPSERGDEEEPTTADQSSVEFDEQLLAEYLGRQLTRARENPVWRDERFLNWFAADARAQYERAHHMSDAEFRRQGEDFMVRVHAKRLRVQRTGAAPRTERGSFDRADAGPVSQGPVPVVELGIAAGVGRELWDEPVTSWVELPPDVPSGKYVALKIVGDSMAPLMHTGDTVLVRVESRVQRDTVVVARHPDDGYVCKRVHRVRRKTIELSSLEPGRPIITIPRDPACIVGTVLLVWCRPSR